MPLPETAILQSLMQWRTRVSAAAWLVVRDTHAAEDIFQNVALKALTRDVVFDSEAALLSWALICARREGIDWLRRHRHEAACPGDDLLDQLDREWSECPSPASNPRLDALRDCLEAIPNDARRLLRLRYFEGRRCDDVARDLHLELDAVYKRLSRLHQNLRQCVEGKLAAGGTP